jgi:hypothetical protein
MTSLARAQDQGGPLQSPVQLELRNDGPDDQLIKLARAAKINLIADATDEPGATLTVSTKQSLLSWLHDIAYANRLSWQRNGGNTVVLWQAPDVVPLARRIVEESLAQRAQLEAQIQPILHEKLDPELVARLDAEPAKWPLAMRRHDLYRIVITDKLRTFLQEKHGWDGQSQDFQLQLQDEQIPAALREQILLNLRLRQIRPENHHSQWLGEDVWQQARLMVEQSKPPIMNGKVQPMQWSLSVQASHNGKIATRSVANLVDGERGEQ